MPQPTHQADKDGLQMRLQEAARYALLRRLTPALRHHMIGALQPLGMLAAMLERRAQAAAPDLASIQKKSADMGVMSREATTSCVGLVGWIAPKTADNVTLAEGVKDSLSVVETDLALRGFTVLVDETVAAMGQLPRAAVRNVFTAALLAITDLADQPYQVGVSAEAAGGEIVIKLELTPREAQDMGIGGSAYRKLEWIDVQALAGAEGVTLSRNSQAATLRCAAT